MEVFRRRRRRGEWWLTLLVALLFSQLPKGHAKARVFNIFWNTTNPMFRIDNTDNVIDVNRGNSVFEYDQAHIICPVYPAGTRPLDAERYIDSSGCFDTPEGLHAHIYCSEKTRFAVSLVPEQLETRFLLQDLPK